MSHYWTADDHPATRQAQIEDWIDDLVEFELDIIEEVCREWRRTEIKRPLPAQLRDRASQERDYRNRVRERVQAQQPKSYEDLRTQCRRYWINCHVRWTVAGSICHLECKNFVLGYYRKPLEERLPLIPSFEEQKPIYEDWLKHKLAQVGNDEKFPSFDF